jgi:hypothetical protein
MVVGRTWFRCGSATCEFGSFWEEYRRGRSLSRAPSVGTHTISLDAVTSSAVEWMAATRLLSTDLVHAFGLPEVIHITEEGHLNRTYLGDQAVAGWRSATGIPVVDHTIPDL